MTSVLHSKKVYQFSDFKLDLNNRQLILHEKPVSLNAKYFDVLALLVLARELLALADVRAELAADVLQTEPQLLLDLVVAVGDAPLARRHLRQLVQPVVLEARVQPRQAQPI